MTTKVAFLRSAIVADCATEPFAASLLGDHATTGGGLTDAPAAPPPRPHLACLDGLRGVAILMVLMVHASQLVVDLPNAVRDFAFYGVRGVQLFFIVSGFTLALNYAGKPFRPLAFAARRFFRIAPMFYFGAILYLTLAYATDLAPVTRGADAADIGATLLFLHGWLPSAINTVVPGGWSIAAEAMFYVCFPLLLPLTGRPRTLGIVLLVSYGMAGVTYLVLRRMPGPEWLEMARYFWLVQLPAFVGGCWLAALAKHDTLPRRGAHIVLVLAALAMLVDSQLRGLSNQLVAMLLLTTFAGAALAARPRWLENRWLILIGQISFSLYILQFAVLAVLHPFVPTAERAVGPVPALLVVFAVALAITGGLAWCSYRWIERPAIRFGRRFGEMRVAR